MWVAYGLWPEQFMIQGDESLQQYTHARSKASIYASVVVFVALSYIAAWAWMRWVDTACATAAKRWENLVFENEEDSLGDKVEYECGHGACNGLIEGTWRVAYRPDRPALPI